MPSRTILWGCDSVLDGSEGFKELGENVTRVRLDIRELMTEVKSLKSLQDMVIDHHTRLKTVEDMALAAHKRQDKTDKIITGIVLTVITAIILAVMETVLK